MSLSSKIRAWLQMGRTHFLTLHLQHPLLKLVFIFCFSKRIDLASNVLHGIAMMKFLITVWLLRSLLMLAIHYITIRLKYLVSNLKKIGRGCKRATPTFWRCTYSTPVKIFRNHPCIWSYSCFQNLESGLWESSTKLLKKWRKFNTRLLKLKS